jgi:hypothetical protein
MSLTFFYSVVARHSQLSSPRPGQGFGGPPGQAAWTVQLVQNNTLPAGSLAFRQQGGPPSWASALASATLVCLHTLFSRVSFPERRKINRQAALRPFLCKRFPHVQFNIIKITLEEFTHNANKLIFQTRKFMIYNYLGFYPGFSLVLVKKS